MSAHPVVFPASAPPQPLSRAVNQFRSDPTSIDRLDHSHSEPSDNYQDPYRLIMVEVIALSDLVIGLIRRSRPSELIAGRNQFTRLLELLSRIPQPQRRDSQSEEPLLLNYRSRLQTLSFELRRVRTLLIRERIRIQSEQSSNGDTRILQ